MERVRRVPTDRGLGVRAVGGNRHPHLSRRPGGGDAPKGCFLPRCEEERRSLRLKRERDEADSMLY